MADIRVVVVGAAGRMGRMLVRAIHEAGAKAGTAGGGNGIALVAAVERAGSDQLGEDAGLLAGIGALGVPVTEDAAAAFAGADVVLDFTSPAATLAFAQLAAQTGVAHVVGTTGLSAQDIAALKNLSSRTCIVQSGNTSLGVTLLAAVAKRVAAALGEEYDIEVVEMHHRMKVDAPSGTALMLGEAAAQGRGIALSECSARGRDGITGARRTGDIGFASLRGGTVVGEHSVVFAGPHERITLSHHAEDRALFARGAVKAALWTKGRAPGFYSMADVLGVADL